MSEFKEHLFSYHHNGSWWTITIRAPTAEDAKERLAKLPWAKYDGVLIATLPAGMGWFARLAVWAGNRF